MRTPTYIALILMVCLATCSVSYAGTVEVSSLSGKNYTAGIDLYNTFGFVQKNDNGQPTGVWGLSILAGITYKGYFKPVEADQWNMFWRIGEIAIFIPYIGIGLDYVWGNGVYFGCGMHLGIVPALGGSPPVSPVAPLPDIHLSFLF